MVEEVEVEEVVVVMVGEVAELSSNHAMDLVVMLVLLIVEQMWWRQQEEEEAVTMIRLVEAMWWCVGD